MVLAAGTCWIAFPSASVASVRFGADLTQPASGLGVGCSAGSTCTNATVVPPSACGQIASPVSGTVVRFLLETHSGSTAPTVGFQVIGSPDGGATFASTGTTSPVATPTTTTTTEFPAQLPIQAGDYIGVEFGSASATALYAIAAQSGAQLATFKPALIDGGAPESPAQALLGNYAIPLAADVALPPTSTAQIPPCSPSGAIPVTVTADPDPAVAPAAVHFRIDGGPEQTVATAGNPGTATIAVPNGSHTLGYWGADTVGGVESTHHTATVVVDTVNHCAGVPPPVVAGVPPPVVAGVPTALAVSPATYKLTGREVKRRCVKQTATNNSQPRCTRPIKLQITYTLTAPATATFTLKRLLPGRKVNGRCVKPTSKNNKQRRCTRNQNVPGSISGTGKSGANTFTFTGKMGGHKLGPGIYQLIATTASGSRSAKFQIGH